MIMQVPRTTLGQEGKHNPREGTGDGEGRGMLGSHVESALQVEALGAAL